MNKKQEYVDKLQGQLAGLNAKINILQTQAAKADSTYQSSYYQTIEELSLKRQVVESKLNQLKNAGDEDWENLKEGMENAWADFSKAVEAAIARFR